MRRSAVGGTPEFRPFLLFDPAVSATLQGLTISGGHTPAGAAGGGIANLGGTLTLLDCAVTRNTTVPSGGTGGEGGGVYQEGGTLTLTNTTISENSAGGAGGGLYATGATTTASNILISDNTATNGDGGGLYQDGGTLTVTGANVTGNTAPGIGGGLRITGGQTTLTGGTVTDNIAAGSGGGGLSIGGGTVTLINSVVSGNTASGGSGGGLRITGGQTTLTGSTVANNAAAGSGGGGLFISAGTVTLTNNTISTNHADNGVGGGLRVSGGTVGLTNSTVSGNNAESDGGGLSVTGGTVTLRFVTVTGNAGATGGGLATQNSGTIAILGSIVAGNNAALSGADCGGPGQTSGGDNVVSDGGGCLSDGTNDLAYAGELSALLDPPLADNGGPTPTRALPRGSPALDRVPVDRCGGANGADQRGVLRAQGPGCDSGAFELRYYTLITGPPPALAQFPAGTNISLTPLPDPGQIFIAWTLDGVRLGWFAPIDIYMDTDHTVQATYVPAVSFPDVPSNRPDFTAITELASRGTIRGYANGKYGPDDGVQRAQMAALIARATLAGPGTPTGGTLAPPACLATGTWDCEDWGNAFTDRNGLDANLWRNVGALQHYQVAFGYDGAACAARGVAAPCYAPTAAVSYVETIVFITRAMIAKGYWQQ